MTVAPVGPNYVDPYSPAQWYNPTMGYGYPQAGGGGGYGFSGTDPYSSAAAAQAMSSMYGANASAGASMNNAMLQYLLGQQQLTNQYNIAYGQDRGQSDRMYAQLLEDAQKTQYQTGFENQWRQAADATQRYGYDQSLAGQLGVADRNLQGQLGSAQLGLQGQLGAAGISADASRYAQDAQRQTALSGQQNQYNIAGLQGQFGTQQAQIQANAATTPAYLQQARFNQVYPLFQQILGGVAGQLGIPIQQQQQAAAQGGQPGSGYGPSPTPQQLDPRNGQATQGGNPQMLNGQTVGSMSDGAMGSARSLPGGIDYQARDAAVAAASPTRYDSIGNPIVGNGYMDANGEFRNLDAYGTQTPSADALQMAADNHWTDSNQFLAGGGGYTSPQAAPGYQAGNPPSSPQPPYPYPPVAGTDGAALGGGMGMGGAGGGMGGAGMSGMGGVGAPLAGGGSPVPAGQPSIDLIPPSTPQMWNQQVNEQIGKNTQQTAALNNRIRESSAARYGMAGRATDAMVNRNNAQLAGLNQQARVQIPQQGRQAYSSYMLQGQQAQEQQYQARQREALGRQQNQTALFTPLISTLAGFGR